MAEQYSPKNEKCYSAFQFGTVLFSLKTMQNPRFWVPLVAI
jgi:hypothetical protein